MDAAHWLTEVRESCDTVAGSCADQVRDGLGGAPYLWVAFGPFADLVLAGGRPDVDPRWHRST